MNLFRVSLFDVETTFSIIPCTSISIRLPKLTKLARTAHAYDKRHSHQASSNVARNYEAGFVDLESGWLLNMHMPILINQDEIGDVDHAEVPRIRVCDLLSGQFLRTHTRELTYPKMFGIHRIGVLNVAGEDGQLMVILLNVICEEFYLCKIIAVRQRLTW